MIEHIGSLGQTAELDCDVCIVGAGAAGLSLAAHLQAAGLCIIVLEAGDREIDEAAQELFEGEVIGEPIAVKEGRFRVFGGATRRWTGRCAELDPIDFEPRAWVPGSGWPISLQDLKPYYRKAEGVCGFARPWCAETQVPGARKAKRLFALQDIRLFIWRYAAVNWRAYQDWGRRFEAQLAQASNARVLLGADVVGAEGDAKKGAVSCLKVRKPDGGLLRVRARRFVLSCGGLENTRLLLNFCADRRSGVRDPHDVVGRWFMQHPRAVTARGRTSQAVSDLLRVAAVRRGDHYEMGFALSQEAQARDSLLNASAVLRYRPERDNGWEVVKRWASREARVDASTLNMVLRDLPLVVSNLLRRALGRDAIVHKPMADLLLDLEQTPDRESRVTLSDQVDRLGLRRLRVDWRIGPQDRRTSTVFTLRLIEEMRRLGLAELQPVADLEASGALTAEHMLESYHHLGGARMSDDPRLGVVDRDLKVHACQNLYVVGGSVMPTGGHANPTFTIVALALRLADHLAALGQTQPLAAGALQPAPAGAAHGALAWARALSWPQRRSAGSPPTQTA